MPDTQAQNERNFGLYLADWSLLYLLSSNKNLMVVVRAMSDIRVVDGIGLKPLPGVLFPRLLVATKITSLMIDTACKTLRTLI
jgi:hypothetical protein